MTGTTRKVYASIVAVTAELAQAGIAKTRKNPQQGYSFRGIDDIYQHLSPALVRNNLCILPRVKEVKVLDRINKKETVLIYTTVTMDFDIVSALDGSVHTVTTIGEAMDSGDKSANKAQSSAYKYMALQTFCIPTEGDNDTENQTHEVVVDPAILTELRAAAMDGIQALQDAFAKHKADPAFPAVWKAHGDGLKAAAAQAEPA